MAAATLPPASLPQIALPEVSHRVELDAARSAAARLAEIGASARGLEVTHEVRQGAPGPELVRALRELDASLVVVGTHRRHGWARVLQGSVSAELVRHAACPILVIAAEQRLSFPLSEVIAAVDLSSGSAQVVARAAELLGGKGQLTLLSAIHVPSPFGLSRNKPLTAPLFGGEFDAKEDQVRDRLGALTDGLPPDVETRFEVLFDDPKAALLRVAARRNPGLLVLGRSGHNVVERAFVGSTASKVLAEATCPVVVVPREDLER
jgi:nucleotide-binding universal stress UspA family protein